MDEKSGNNGGEMGAPTVEEGQIFHALKAWIEANRDEDINISDEEITDFLKALPFAEIRIDRDCNMIEVVCPHCKKRLSGFPDSKCEKRRG